MQAQKLPGSILVVSGSQKTGSLLRELLPAAGFPTVTAVQSCGEAKRILVGMEFDLIVINTPLGDDFGVSLAMDAVQNSLAAVLLLVSAELYAGVCDQVEDLGVLTLSKPTTKNNLYAAIRLGLATRARLKLAQQKNESLTAKMNEIRVVNRAKWVLIKYLNMTEDQAHRFIEKQAMDMRLTRREVAENLIKTYES